MWQRLCRHPRTTARSSACPAVHVCGQVLAPAVRPLIAGRRSAVHFAAIVWFAAPSAIGPAGLRIKCANKKSTADEVNKAALPKVAGEKCAKCERIRAYPWTDCIVVDPQRAPGRDGLAVPTVTASAMIADLESGDKVERHSGPGEILEAAGFRVPTLRLRSGQALSKTAKGGAASIVVVQGWASPQPRLWWCKHGPAPISELNYVDFGAIGGRGPPPLPGVVGSSYLKRCIGRNRG